MGKHNGNTKLVSAQLAAKNENVYFMKNVSFTFLIFIVGDTTASSFGNSGSRVVGVTGLYVSPSTIIIGGYTIQKKRKSGKNQTKSK